MSALYLAYRDPRVPWYAKAWIIVVTAYAFSPIDLIPDFIPVLGYVDDLILIPLGVMLAVRMVPPHVLAECREKARSGARPASLAGAIMVVCLWLFVLALLIWLFTRS